MRIYTKLTLLAVLALIISGCSSSLQMNSPWRDREIAIDGVLNEWQGGTTFIKKENVVIGFFNDAENFYVSLTSSDRGLQRQFMIMGFTLWLDAKGGKSRDFGVKFPVGMMEMGMNLRSRMGEEGLGGRRAIAEKSLSDLEIIMRKKGGVKRMKIAEAGGIEVKVAGFSQNLIYEIKIPIQSGDAHPFALDAKMGETIGVGFETAKLDRQALQDRMGEGRRGGRGGGRGGRRGGGRGGRQGGFGRAGGPQQMPDSFKLWVTVKLGTEKDRVTAQLLQDESANLQMPVDPLPYPATRASMRDIDDGAPKAGDMAPVFSLKSLDGKSETSLASFRGKKPVVLFFGSYT